MTLPFRRSRAAVRPSPVFLAVLVVAAIGGYLAWNAENDTRGARVGVFLFVIAGWVVTLSLHEFAHAFLAWRFGDDEVSARGYLTLNPLKYSHPVLSILLPVVFIALGGIGLPGGAVFVHPGRFRTDRQRALMSFAGPAVNLVFAVGLLIAVRHNETSAHSIFWLGVSFLALLQLMATVLNLLPIPGLDGWGVIEPYLDPKFRAGAEQVKPFGMLIVFVLIYQVPSLNRALFDAIYWLFELSGVSRNAAAFGYQLIKFWQAT